MASRYQSSCFYTLDETEHKVKVQLHAGRVQALANCCLAESVFPQEDGAGEFTISPDAVGALRGAAERFISQVLCLSMGIQLGEIKALEKTKVKKRETTSIFPSGTRARKSNEREKRKKNATTGSKVAQVILEEEDVLQGLRLIGMEHLLQDMKGIQHFTPQQQGEEVEVHPSLLEEQLV